MDTAKSKRLAAILADDVFKETVEARKAHLTAKVMSAATSTEDREKTLAEFHALDRLVNWMRSAATTNEE